jgi:hypothetical protein
MAENVFIGRGHGYEVSDRGRCTAFDGFDVIAAPLDGHDAVARARRVLGRKADGTGGVCYGAYTVKLAKRADDRDLYLLVHHGGGREVYRVPALYDRGALESHILSLPETMQFNLLMTLYRIGRQAYDQAEKLTRRNWAQAFVDKRIKKSRATKYRGPVVEIVPPAA